MLAVDSLTVGRPDFVPGDARLGSPDCLLSFTLKRLSMCVPYLVI